MKDLAGNIVNSKMTLECMNTLPEQTTEQDSLGMGSHQSKFTKLTNSQGNQLTSNLSDQNRYLDWPKTWSKQQYIQDWVMKKAEKDWSKALRMRLSKLMLSGYCKELTANLLQSNKANVRNPVGLLIGHNHPRKHIHMSDTKILFVDFARWKKKQLHTSYTCNIWMWGAGTTKATHTRHNWLLWMPSNWRADWSSVEPN